MPEEVLALIIVVSFLTFITTVIRSTQQYKLKKLDRERGSSDESLTTSELKNLIEDAVAEATAPIAAEVDELSRRLASVERSAPQLELEDTDSGPDKTLGRQGRQRQY